MSTTFAAVDQLLTVIAGDDAAFESYALSMVFANAAARAAGREGADVDGFVERYVKTWYGALGQLGWTVTDAGRTTLSQTSSAAFGGGKTTTLAAEIERQTANRATPLLDALEAMAGGDPSAADDRLLGLWWRAATARSGLLLMGFGSVGGSAVAPAFRLDLATIDLAGLKAPGTGILGHATAFTPESPADLFADVLETGVDLTVRNVSATLDTEVFERRRADVVAKLGTKFAEHYAVAGAGS